MKYWTVLFTLSFFFILIANAINIKNTEKSRLPIPASIHNPKTEYRQAIHFRIKNELSDSPETKKLDNAIEKFLRKWEIKGASFALMKDNKLVYAKGYGIADNETGTTPSNIFRIASVSKLITAAGIMKLVESGRLKLDDCVFGENGILNDNDFTNIKDSRIKDITVEHLLRHRSGFSSRYGDPVFSPLTVAKTMKVSPPISSHTLIRYAISKKLHYTPGQSTSYSNLGYVILSKIIEKVSERDYEEFIQKEILHPAGCFDMHIARNFYKERYKNEVRYYESKGEEPILSFDGKNKERPKCYGGNDINLLWGAGAWVASPSELLLFTAAIDGDPAVPDILKPETVAYMTKHDTRQLPIGWMHTRENGEWIRTGTLSSTSAVLKRQNDGYSWVFVTNTGSWKGPKLASKIETMIKNAMRTVKKWPEQDLKKQ